MSSLDAWDALSEPWRECLQEAWESWCDGSAGVGAVIVDRDGRIVARGRNRRHDPRLSRGTLTGTRLAHAEMCALAELPPGPCEHYTLYTTFEPCLMCAGAVWAARIGRVVFGAADPKAGATGSLYNFSADPRLNHETAVVAGVRAPECAELLTALFRSRRPS